MYLTPAGNERGMLCLPIAETAWEREREREREREILCMCVCERERELHPCLTVYLCSLHTAMYVYTSAGAA